MYSTQRIRLTAKPDVQFLASPIIEWLHAMDLAALFDEWGEGLAPWILNVRDMLQPDERDEFAACALALSWWRLLAFVSREDGLMHDFDWLLSRLRGLDDEDFIKLTDERLVAAARETPIERATVAVHNHLIEAESGFSGSDLVAQRIVDLLREPSRFKLIYLRTAEMFLRQHLQHQWESDQPLLEHEVDLRKDLSAPATLQAWIQRLTGRSVGLSEAFTQQENVLAVPTRTLGPYVTVAQLPDMLLLVYGLRTAQRSLSHERFSTPAAGFKALGDETRYRILEMTAGQEMYAHEIGKHFSHVGQPAISRHLRYLAAEGLLDVRDAQAKKYYSLNRSAIQHLQNQLDDLAT